MSSELPFWQVKPLTEMTRDEWEQLCDGCGQCCLHKLQDEETDEVFFTNVACRQLDTQTARCKKYAERQRFVPGCIVLTPSTVGDHVWLPKSCSYRLINEGKDLPAWHPLVSNTANSVAEAGISVGGHVVDERDAGDLEDHLVTWPEGPSK